MFDKDAGHLEVVAEALERIFLYLRGFDEDSFAADQRTVDAVALNLLVTGEASIHLSKALKAQVALPWGEMAGLRHHIAHGYFGLSPVRLWRTASVDAPVLRVQVAAWLEAR